MSTTALFVDFLIIGVQAGVWLAMLVLTIIGYNPINPTDIKGWETIVSVISLAFVYPLGLLVDQSADRLLLGKTKRLRAKILGNQTITILELLLKAKDTRLTGYFDYLRIRIRISRSTMLNFTFAAIIAPTYLMIRNPLNMEQVGLYAALVGIGCLLIARFAYTTWHQVSEQNFTRLIEANAVVDRLPPSMTIGTIQPSTPVTQLPSNDNPSGD